jgi:hypothetical protein
MLPSVNRRLPPTVTVPIRRDVLFTSALYRGSLDSHPPPTPDVIVPLPGWDKLEEKKGSWLATTTEECSAASGPCTEQD